MPDHSSNHRADLGEAAERAVHHQQNKEHVELPDLRHALLDVPGGQQRDHGAGHEQCEWKLDGRQTNWIGRKQQRRQREGQENLRRPQSRIE